MIDWYLLYVARMVLVSTGMFLIGMLIGVIWEWTKDIVKYMKRIYKKDRP